VTNAQYARFVEAGGYDQPEFWSKEGWTWRKKQNRVEPVWWEDPEWNNSIFPVVGVTWFEAVGYCKWLTERLQTTGHLLQVWRDSGIESLKLEPGTFAVRLPTREEWEWAARGTDGGIYPWGDEFGLSRANTQETELKCTTAVCTYPQGASSAGVFDAVGNVWEWTASQLEAGPECRVLCGGSWDSNHSQGWRSCKGHIRDGFDNDVGFRLAVCLAKHL
jgi:formylglycine-generating enzyme required for sulfatase activity